MILTKSARSACTLLACMNNPNWYGQEPSRNIDLSGDMEEDEPQGTKIQLHSTVHGNSGYQNDSDSRARLVYV